MKKLTLLLGLMISLFINNSCEKDYKNEVFVDDFKYIYGEWTHFKTIGGWNGLMTNTDEYKINFIPNAKFSYNDSKSALIKVISQSDHYILIDFNLSFPRISSGYVGLIGHDTLIIRDPGFDLFSHYYVRLAK